jgi:hypothetical protein
MIFWQRYLVAVVEELLVRRQCFGFKEGCVVFFTFFLFFIV